MARTIHDRVKQETFEHPRQEALINLLVTSGHYRQILNDICRQFDITHDQYNVHRILKGVHPEGHPRNEIIERMIERTPDVTRLLDRLARKDLVCRTKSEVDLRLSIAKITEKGIELLEQIDPEINSASRKFVKGVSEADLKQFSEFCNDMLANVTD
ncbi:MAG: hypothetical protein R3281_14345 [Balneolaceae bacterium]|nr:hypothetical protein [Balneolaceae bacterium]